MVRDPMDSVESELLLSMLQSYAPALTHSDVLCLKDSPLLLEAIHEMTAKQGQEDSVGKGMAGNITEEILHQVARDEEKVRLEGLLVADKNSNSKQQSTHSSRRLHCLGSESPPLPLISHNPSRTDFQPTERIRIVTRFVEFQT